MNLQTYRSNIDLIDNEIIKLLEKRKNYTTKIGEIKQKHNLKILCNEREIEILHRLKSKSEILEYWEVDEVFGAIFRNSRQVQRFTISKIQEHNRNQDLNNT